jgi:glyoxylase-like metal-dependent hydrolase (beta-lactamase superfamily II)
MERLFETAELAEGLHTVVDVLGNHAYLVLGNSHALLVDTCGGIGNIRACVEDMTDLPVTVALTHGHDDHFGAVNELKREFGLLTYIMKEEEEFVQSVNFNLSGLFGHPRVTEPEMFFVDGQKVRVLGTEMTAILTPGHTPGGACYYFPEEKLLFSGDTLFCESVGRSDFPGGNGEQLIRSVREKLMPLPDDVKVYPGHGPDTTIGYERRHNPYVRGSAI